MASFRQIRSGRGNAQLSIDGQLLVAMQLEPPGVPFESQAPFQAVPVAQLLAPGHYTTEMMQAILKLTSTHPIRRARARYIKDGLKDALLHRALCDFVVKIDEKGELPKSIPQGLLTAWAQELDLIPSSSGQHCNAEQGDENMISKAMSTEDEAECRAFWADLAAAAEGEAVEEAVCVTSPAPMSLDGKCVALTQLNKQCRANAMKGGNLCRRHTDMYASGKSLGFHSLAAETAEQPSEALASVELDQQDEDGMTQLMWAAGLGDLDKVRSLVVSGASLQATDRVYSMTACDWAAHCGYASVVDFITAHTNVATGMVIGSYSSVQGDAAVLAKDSQDDMDVAPAAAKRHCATKLAASAAGGEAERCEHGNCNMELHICCPHAGCGRRLCAMHMTTSACHEHGTPNCPCIFCRFSGKHVEVPKGLPLSFNWKLGCEILLRHNAQLSDDLSAVNDQFGELDCASGLLEEKRALEARVESLEGDVGQLEDKVDTLKAENIDLEREVLELEAEVKELDNKVVDLQAEIKELKDELQNRAKTAEGSNDGSSSSESSSESN